MKILVTGGHGFIGSTLVKKLLKSKNNLILNIDANKRYSMPESLYSISKNKNYSFKKIDLYDYKTLRKTILNFKPDLVYNLAAESHVDRSIMFPKSFIDSNIIGTFNILEVLREYLYKLKKNKKFCLIHVSTDEVFGSLKLNEKQFNENNKFMPNSPYSASKASSDLLCRAWNKTYDLPVITTNCSNNYGPWQFPEKLIPTVILKCIKKEKIPIYGNGKNIRDWLFVDDHIDALIKISQKGKIGETYNIGGDNEISNINIVNLICKLLDDFKINKFKHNSLIVFVDDRLGHDFRYGVDLKKIKRKINFKPKVNFEEGLKKTVIWYLNNKKWLLKKNN